MSVTAAPGRDLTPQEEKQRAERCYALEQDIKEGMKTGRALMWATAKALHEFDEEQGWSALGHDRLSDWLAEPDVGITRATYYRMVQAYREIVVLRGVPHEELPELDVSKVQVVLPALKAGDVKLRGALKDIKTLGFRDLREQYMKPRDTGNRTVPPEQHDDDLTAPETGEVEILPPENENDHDATQDPVEGLEDIEGDVAAGLTIKECLDSLRATTNTDLPNIHTLAGACEQGIETLERCAQLLVRVLDEVGRPEQKRMKSALRETIKETLG